MSESDFALKLNCPTDQLQRSAVPPYQPRVEALPLNAIPAAFSAPLDLLKWAVSFPAMLAVVLVGFASFGSHQFVLDPDVWWHIRNGEAILAANRWPTTDPYSFSVRGFPWMTFEWLGDVLLAVCMRLAGLGGLAFFLFFVGSAIVLALYVYGTIRTGKSKAGFLAAAIVTPLVMTQFNARPQMIGYLLLVFTMIILTRFRQNQTKAVWLLPPLMLIWINLHASWIIGMGALFVYWVAGLFNFQLGGIVAKKCRPIENRRISLVFLLSLVLLNVNPYGTELTAFPFKIQASCPISYTHVLEWLPMPFDQTVGKIFIGLLLGFIAAQVTYGFTWRLEEFVLFLSGIAAACVHFRFLLIFVPFFLPLLAVTCARWVPIYERNKDKYFVNGILIAAIVIGIVHYYPTQSYLERKVDLKSPVKAVEFLQSHPQPEPMFNTYDFGGYLVWTGRKVFIDGRSELYEDGGVLADYFDLTLLKPGGLDILRRYQIQSCLLKTSDPLTVVLAALPDWQKVYSDPTSTIFVRKGNGLSAESPRVTAGNLGEQP
jgi:hypothetical protein